ncbi:MAG: response regulator [Eudoraea sp.]|nr:response regulator [Eudoraea sp.]
MKVAFFYTIFCLFVVGGLSGQQVYDLNPMYPVHDLDGSLQVVADSTDRLTPEILLQQDNGLMFTPANELPVMLEPNITYWGKLQIKALDSLKGWTLHFEDIMIGPPAWTKSNGRLDVYAYMGEQLLFHQKTGVEVPYRERATKDSWFLNSINLHELPVGQPVTIIIKAQGNDFGYPPYFNLSARSPEQPYYQKVNQFHNSFNTFMFGVTFIIFLFFLLQYLYLKDQVYFWFSLWLFFCAFTQAMTIGLIIDHIQTWRYPLWFFIANGIFFTFWFFGRAFVESKKKFPKLDKFILGLAFFVLIEIVLTALYVIFFNPKIHYIEPGIHFQLLNIYTLGSLIISLVLTFKKDLFARYFGIGSLIASIFLVIGTLWSMGLIKPPFRLDPYVTGLFLQIVIYSFGMAYRSQKISEQNQLERLGAAQSVAEIQRMKDLDEVKTRFFANISHEFRTPLSLIHGPLQQAKKASDTTSGTIVISNKAYGIIKKNITRLQNLVNQLLDLSKLESGTVHLKLQQGGLIQYLRSQVFSFESVAEQRNISLNTHFPEEMEKAYYDKDKLEKILNNLLSNSFKYTPAGGAVTVNVSCSDKTLLIEISDSGNGMSKKEIDRIFDRFYRVEGSEVKGSGIGLALTKELVDLHRGQISVHSEKGRGTTFKVRLPLELSLLPKSVKIDHSTMSSEPIIADSSAELSGESEEEQRTSHENGEVVLLVEDNEDLMEYISEILSPKFDVITAKDGLQGERMAFEHIPDLIVSDVMMPEKDGYELCNTLKKNIKTSHIPIILLTAKAGQENKIAGLTQGADAYLTKPFDADELLLRIENLIQARKKIWEHFKTVELLEVKDLKIGVVDDKFLQKVIQVIKENMDNELLSVEDIASKVGFSRAQLHRKLKALTNKSARQLVSEIRMNKAKSMLQNKAGSVSEVAYSVGYSNLSYFTKSFKEKFGVLPSKV